MSETQTIDVNATNVTEPGVNSDTEEVIEMAQAINNAHVLGNALLSQLWSAKDDNERGNIISNADPTALAMAMANSVSYVLAKTNPNDSRLNILPAEVRDGMAKLVEKIDRSVLIDVSRMLTKHNQRSADEILSSYNDLGPVYAGVPLAVDFGLEAGIRTGSDEDTQRAGLIFGLRLDHFTKVKPQRRIGLSKATR